MLAQIAIFLVDTVVAFFVFLLLARFHFQWLRVPFRNPLGEFVLATTSWCVVPARRVIPGLAGLDLPTLLLAWVLQGLGLWIQAAIVGAEPGLAPIAALAAVDLLRYSLYILVFAIIVQVVLLLAQPARAVRVDVRPGDAPVPAPAAALRAADRQHRPHAAGIARHASRCFSSSSATCARRRSGCDPRALILELHVQPGARVSEFAGRHGDRIKVRLAARAVDGKANEALIEFLAAHYGVAKRDVRITAGLKSRQKRVVISGLP